MIAIIYRGKEWAHFLTIALLLASGCASLPPDKFGDVRKNVADRTGQTILWIGHGQDQANVDALVRSNLSKPLSADDAVRVALLNNPKLQADFDELGVARADVLRAGTIRNPVLNVVPRFPDRPPSGVDIEVSVEEDFVSLLALPARKQLAATEYQEAAMQTTAMVLDLASKTRVTFYEYQAAAQMLHLRELAAQDAGAAAETSHRLHEAGNISDLDFAAQQAAAQQARIDLQSAQLDSKDDREQLNELMGLGDGQPIDWSAEPNLPDLPATEIVLENLEQTAIDQRADLAAAKQRVLAASQSLGISQQLRFFDDGSIGIDSERGPGNQTVTGPTISLPIPIFDQGQADVMSARMKLDQAGQEYRALAIQIRAEVRQARNHLASARWRCESYRDQLLPLQQQILDESLKNYNGMLLGVFQLLSARQGQIDAQRGQIESLRDYWISRAQLARALGGRIPGDSLLTQPATRPTSASTMPSMQNP